MGVDHGGEGDELAADGDGGVVPVAGGRDGGHAPVRRDEDAVVPVARLIFYCRTTSASTASCTSRRMCCPTHCAPCQPLLRAFSGWIRSPPPTISLPRKALRGVVPVARGGDGGHAPVRRDEDAVAPAMWP